MQVISEKPTLAISSEAWHSVARFGLSKELMSQIEKAYPVINVLWHKDANFASYNVNAGDRFCVPDADDLQRLERDNRWVTETWKKIELVQFQASFCLMSICRKGTEVAQFPSTYSFKHDVEDVSRMHISEGALVLGALFAGFTVTPKGETDVLVDDVYRCMVRILTRAKNEITSRELVLA